MVVFGNGEVLLGPAAVWWGKRCLSITGAPGKCQAAERKSVGAVVAGDGAGGAQPALMRRAPASSMHDVVSEGVGQ